MNDHVYLDYLIEDMENGKILWEKEGDGYLGVWETRWRKDAPLLPIHIMKVGNDYEWGYCCEGGRTMANSKVYKLVKLIRKQIGDE